MGDAVRIKRTRRIRITTAKPANVGGKLGVELNALGLEGADHDRPHKAFLAPADARLLAEELIRWADWAEGGK